MSFVRSESPLSPLFIRTLDTSSQSPSSPNQTIPATEQSINGLRQLPQIAIETSTAPIMSTPPIVGVPLLSNAE